MRNMKSQSKLTNKSAGSIQQMINGIIFVKPCRGDCIDSEYSVYFLSVAVHEHFSLSICQVKAFSKTKMRFL